jgi:hypothetical protein
MGAVPVDHRPEVVTKWLSWASVGMEGVVHKRLDGASEPSARGWLQYKVRETTEAVVGAVTGPAAPPRSLLLGRYDDEGHLQHWPHHRPLPDGQQHGRRAVRAGPARPPWTGWLFSAGWGTRETLDVTLVEPELMVESALMSPATPPAGGATPHAGTAPAPTSPPPTSPAGRQRRTDGGTARRPRLALNTSEGAPILGCVRAAHPASLLLHSSRDMCQGKLVESVPA